MEATAKFRRNVLYIAVVHVVLIGGLVGYAMWSEGKAKPPEPIEWLDPASFTGTQGAASSGMPLLAAQPADNPVVQANIPVIHKDETHRTALPPPVPEDAPTPAPVEPTIPPLPRRLLHQRKTTSPPPRHANPDADAYPTPHSDAPAKGYSLACSRTHSHPDS